MRAGVRVSVDLLQAIEEEWLHDRAERLLAERHRRRRLCESSPQRVAEGEAVRQKDASVRVRRHGGLNLLRIRLIQLLELGEDAVERSRELFTRRKDLLHVDLAVARLVHAPKHVL